MAPLTTILRALVVALVVALAGSQSGDAGATSVAVQASQIAVAQAALSSAPPATSLPRTWRSTRPPPSRPDLAVSEYEGDSDDSELKGGEKSSPACSSGPLLIELQARSQDVAASRTAAIVSVVMSDWMPTGHPRGPPAVAC